MGRVFKPKGKTEYYMEFRYNGVRWIRCCETEDRTLAKRKLAREMLRVASDY